ncbi:MAG: DUF3516 domain-containing protein, partial [Thermoanaerobaculia bacterium]|nr:DUF3516 domain-containing protein [Thermoanaerobaculia bacterium]
MSEPLPRPTRPSLAARIPPGGTSDPDEILDLFLAWVSDLGLTLYPAQEEALLELLAGKHVILNTPTGSGKSLVALGLHFKGLCEGTTSFYTSPIKALASEKFFSLCEDLGPEEVGMLTGDASINPDGRVLCCTAEVLSNMCLRRGPGLEAPAVVMDEFHYYSDRDRGVAWQIPLITQPKTQFLLMSATLGDVSGIAEKLKAATGREVAWIHSVDRPVPLDYEYRETPLHETIGDLLAAGKAPIYIVNFTQRECAELAQALTSSQIAPRERRDAIKEALYGARLDTPYGKEFRRFLSFGIGVHHAGLLPKYRLLVEQLSQRGLLPVIAGTDTLGVGVNIPIRTVLFTKLAKFDGKKVTMLAVRDFQQIAGRAGRKGFDDRGSVVAQAPESVIEKKAAAAKGKKKPPGKPKPQGKPGGRPGEGAQAEVIWTEDHFEKLRTRSPETLQSRFRITHGLVLMLLQRDAELDDPNARNFDSLRQLIAASHEDDLSKARHLAHAAALVRSMNRAGILELKRDTVTAYRWVVVSPNFQWDFSLFQALALFLIETLPLLDPQDMDYALDLVTLVESILEDPDVILRKQTERERQKRYLELKAEGADYDFLRSELDEVSHPKPNADFLFGAFERFRHAHPWVGGRDLHPKAIGRDMLERFLGFGEYVRHLGIQRSEGILLRYLSQLYKTLVQTVPDLAKTQEVEDVIGFFRTLLERTDTSLLEEWESLRHPELLTDQNRHQKVEARWITELASDSKLLAARVRTELHLLVKALAERNWEDAAAAVVQNAEDPWDERRFETAMAPFWEDWGDLVATAEARRHKWTTIKKVGEREWEVEQVLLAWGRGEEAGEVLETGWAVRGRVDLSGAREVEGALV